MSESFAQSVRRVTALAAPVALAELGWMMMTTVDTVMIGPLGPAAIGAVGIGSNAFYCFAIAGMGLLFGLDTLVSQAYGAQDREDCHHSLRQALYLTLVITPLLMLLFAWTPPVFPRLGVVPEVSAPAGQFLRVLSLSTLPLLAYGALRRYLQGMGHVRPVMFTLISANAVNWFGNWLLIRGHWGLPALGVTGSALSTGLARLYMTGMLAFFVWWFEHRAGHQSPGAPPRFGLAPDWQRMRLLLTIGTPAALQIFLEIGAFSAVGLLAGNLSSQALAAHQIALNCAALSFMVPLGTSAAAAVAVGHAIGRGDFASARRSGFAAVVIACLFMAVAAGLFVAIPHVILRVYTEDLSVLRIGTELLAWAACFQLFDGVQTVTTGALRGAGETRTPMLVNLLGYWAFGLPVGYFLCFHLGWGVAGLWAGLTLALTLIACVLLYAWQHRSHHLTALIRPAWQPTP